MEPAAIQRADVAAIQMRLEAELPRVPGAADRASGAGAILASDADGTIWDRDVGFDLLEELIAARGFREAAREPLAAEARAIGVAEDGDATAIAAALYEAFEADRYPHDRAFAMMTWSAAGWARDELAAFCAKVLAQRNIDARIRPELLAVFRWAEAHGVDVCVVSASPRVMIEVAAPRIGIALDHIAAMTPALDAHGVVLPRLDGPLVYGPGKLTALERVRPGASGSLLGAFGDSAYDAPMLRAARVPVAVTPTPALLDLAPTIPGLLLLDR